MRTRDIPFRGQKETETEREKERERLSPRLASTAYSRGGPSRAHNRTETFRKQPHQSRAPRIPAEFVPDIAQASKPRVGIAANVPSLITFSSRNHGRVYTYALARVQSPPTLEIPTPPSRLPPLPSSSSSSLSRLKLSGNEFFSFFNLWIYVCVFFLKNKDNDNDNDNRVNNWNVI